MYSAAFENGFTPATVVLDAPVDVGYQAGARARLAARELQRPVLRSVAVARGADQIDEFRDDPHAPKHRRSDRCASTSSASASTTRPCRTTCRSRSAPTAVAPLDVATRLRDVRERRLQGHALFHRSRRDGRRRGVVRGGAALLPRVQYAARDARAARAREAGARCGRRRALSDTARRAAHHLAAERLLDRRHDVGQRAARGSGAAARRDLGRNDLAGKTGTTNDGRDLWFVGFNANIVGASWVGFDQYRPLGAYEQGSSAALPMWIGFMREALAGDGGAAAEAAARHRRVPHQSADRAASRTTARRTRVFEKFDIDHCAGARGGGVQRAARRPRSGRRTRGRQRPPWFRVGAMSGRRRSSAWLSSDLRQLSSPTKPPG